MREVMLIIHFIGLAMGLGTSIGYMFLGIAGSKMEKAEQQKFMLNTFALSNMGKTGIVLLVLSGSYLMTPYWKVLTDTPLLMIKLGLVLFLIILIITISSFMNRVKKGEAEKYAPKIPMVGRLALLTTLAIIILAVYVFH